MAGVGSRENGMTGIRDATTGNFSRNFVLEGSRERENIVTRRGSEFKRKS